MPLPLLIPAFIGLCKACSAVGGIIYCVHKASQAYESHQDRKKDKYNLKSKAIDAANADNKKAQEETAELNKKLAAEEERIKKLEKSLEEAKGKLNRTDLPEEE